MPDDLQTTPLYVRLPRREAELLDRVAHERRVSKRELVTSLVQDGLGAAVPPDAEPGPLIVETGALTRGRYRFEPAPTPEVLTLAQAAELLHVTEPALEGLARAGGLPARRIDGEWRVARAALMAWLAAGEAPPAAAEAPPAAAEAPPAAAEAPPAAAEAPAP